MLLSGQRVCDVAAHLGVNRHTVTTWLKWPEFQEEVYRMAAEPFGAAARENAVDKTNQTGSPGHAAACQNLPWRAAAF